MRKWAFLFFTGTAFATGPFTQLGTAYQDTHSQYSAGDSASASGRYFSSQLALGYEAKSWEAGVSLPYAVRNSTAQYQYASTAQVINTSTQDNGMSDPSLWGARDVFGGNLYAPAVALTGALSAPFGKSTLGLQTWHARPGVTLEYPAGELRLAARFYGEIPFAAQTSVADQYRAYAGAGFTASYPLWRSLFFGADANYAAGDFSRSAPSLRAGGFISIAEILPNLSLYLGSQVELVRTDRDIFAVFSMRYNFADFSFAALPPMGG